MASPSLVRLDAIKFQHNGHSIIVHDLAHALGYIDHVRVRVSVPAEGSIQSAWDDRLSGLCSVESTRRSRHDTDLRSGTGSVRARAVSAT